MLGTLGGIVALGAVPDTGFPQSESVRAYENERVAEEIDGALATDGPRSTALIVPLTELGQQYETEGQHWLATAAYEQARHIVRATYGLHTLAQAPLIGQALENQQAVGNFAMVQALEEELYDLAIRHPADVRAAAIHRDIGARRMNLLRRFLAGEVPPEIYPETGLYSFLRDHVVNDLVSEAQIHYADAAAVILRNGLYASDELRDLEMEIVRASDLIRHRNRPDNRSAFAGVGRLDRMGLGGSRPYGVGVRRRGLEYVSATEELLTRTDSLWDLAGSESSEEAKQRRNRVDLLTQQQLPRYQLARESYRRLIAYGEAVSGSAPADETAWLRRLEAYVHLADWDLLYSQNGVALDEYAQVHQMLKTTSNADPLIAEIFAPPIPITLPTFLPNPLQTPASARHIDVGFEVTRFGESRRIEIVGAAPDVSNAAQDELVSLIKASRFRPRVMDGELSRASPVVVRYYLND
jgi:hypothetical protein